jgi:hypothetical protein
MATASTQQKSVPQGKNGGAPAPTSTTQGGKVFTTPAPNSPTVANAPTAPTAAAAPEATAEKPKLTAEEKRAMLDAVLKIEVEIEAHDKAKIALLDRQSAAVEAIKLAMGTGPFRDKNTGEKMTIRSRPNKTTGKVNTFFVREGNKEVTEI